MASRGCARGQDNQEYSMLRVLNAPSQSMGRMRDIEGLDVASLGLGPWGDIPFRSPRGHRREVLDRIS